MPTESMTTNLRAAPGTGTGADTPRRQAPAGAVPAAVSAGQSADAPPELLAAARFLAASTLSLAATGLLVQAGLLPWVEPGLRPGLLEFYDSLGPRARVAFAAWQASGVLLTAVLPSVALLAWGRQHSDVRRVLAPYVLVLLAQVGTEAVLAEVFFPNIVVLAGVVFTGYRLRQLWRSRRAITASRQPGQRQHRAVRVLLSAGLGFWTTNLAYLLTAALPAILRLP